MAFRARPNSESDLTPGSNRSNNLSEFLAILRTFVEASSRIETQQLCLILPKKSVSARRASRFVTSVDIATLRTAWEGESESNRSQRFLDYFRPQFPNLFRH